MTLLKLLDGQVPILGADGKPSQYETFIPSTNGLTPDLGVTKGTVIAVPADGILPPGFTQAYKYIPHPLQQQLVDDTGAPANRRPRVMGDLGGFDRPDGVPADGVLSYGGITGITRHYEYWIRFDTGQPLTVVDPDDGKTNSLFGVPWVVIAWHGESTQDPLWTPDMDVRLKKQFGQPVIQGHGKRLVKNAKFSFYVKMIGGRYWDPDGPIVRPAWVDNAEGTASGIPVECSREFDVFPDKPGGIPLNEWFYLKLEIPWGHELSGVNAGGLKIWRGKIGDTMDDLLLVADSATTVPAVGPSSVSTPGANILVSQLGNVTTPEHIEHGYYRPQEGRESSFWHPQVADGTDYTWMVGTRIADTEDSLLGPEGGLPGSGGGGGGIGPVAINADPVSLGYDITTGAVAREVNADPIDFFYTLGSDVGHGQVTMDPIKFFWTLSLDPVPRYTAHLSPTGPPVGVFEMVDGVFTQIS